MKTEQLKPVKTNGKSEEPKTAVIIGDKTIADSVLSRVASLEKSGGLNFPANYSYANALKSAWLILQNTIDREKRPALSVCTKESIANSLLDMVIQGLSPVKKQCYFVVYAKQLTLMRSYFGTIAVTKRIEGIADVFGNCIYEGDTFKYRINQTSGLKEIIEHTQEIQNINSAKIIAAYAIIHRDEKPSFIEIMTIDQIRKAWNQGVAYSSGKSTAHNNFTDEMAKKTVINRACKTFLNTSDDSDILIDAINRTTENEYTSEAEYEEEVQTEIDQNANKELIDMNPEPEDAIESIETMNGNNKTKLEPKLNGPGF